jgi:diaminopimelate decarboxylase
LAQSTRPPGFYRHHDGHHDALVCDGVPLAAIAAAEGTPLYVYSAAVLRERYQAIDGAFHGYPHALHYALKANSTLAIARLLRELGSSVDANSVWEDRPRARPASRRRRSSSPASARRPQSSRRRWRSGSRRSNGIGRRAGRLEAVGARLGRAVRVAIASTPTSMPRAIRIFRRV